MVDAFEQWKQIAPDRIVFTGDLVHSKNQMTPELVEFVAWVLNECSKITKTIIIIGNHDFLENNQSRLDALTPIIDSLKNENVVYYKQRGVYEDSNINWCVYSLIDHNIPPEIPQNGKINIIPYQINQSGKYPFLQYFLLKYINKEEEKEEREETIKEKEYISFIKFEHKDNSAIFNKSCSISIKCKEENVCFNSLKE
jgi:hypothetical protein